MNRELPDVQAGFRKGRGLFYTSVSLLLSRTQGYCYHLSCMFVLIPFNAITNDLWSLSFLGRDRALGFGVGVLSPRP